MNTRKFSPQVLIALMLLCACAPAVGADVDTAQLSESTAVATATLWPDTPPESCPITQLPADPFIPPEPHGEYPYEGYVWYGTPELWTAIPTDGSWRYLPHTEKKGYGQKVVFWNEDYDWRTEQRPKLTLNGRRLDGPAPDFVTDHATNGYHDELGAFILIGAGLPTLGCWELTAHYRDAELTFVVWVAP